MNSQNLETIVSSSKGVRATVGGLRRFAVAAIILSTAFGGYSMVRLIDADEGYLLLAARLVGEGRIPYRDFFFPQGPLFPFLYGYVLPSGSGWYGARFLSSLLALTTALLTMFSVKRQGGSARAQLLCAFVMTTAALSFAWLTIAKTYALSAAFLVGAHAVSVARSNWERVRGFLIGLSLSLAISARPYTIAAAPVVLLSCRRSGGRPSLALAGFVVGCLPWLAVYMRAPSNVLYGLVEYHLNRSGLGIGESLVQKLTTVLALIGLGPYDRALAVQFDAVVAMAVLGGIANAQRRWRPAVLLAVVIGGASLALTPTHVQYFALAFPFLTEAACLGLDDIEARFGRVSHRLAFVVAVAFTGLGIAEAWRHAVGGRYVPGIWYSKDAPAWSIPVVEEVARGVASVGASPVLAEWPGYLVGIKAMPVPGAENQFGISAAERMGDAPRRRTLHLSTTEELQREIELQHVPLVITGNATEWHIGEAVVHSGYELRANVRGSLIWQKPRRGAEITRCARPCAIR